MAQHIYDIDIKYLQISAGIKNL